MLADEFRRFASCAGSFLESGSALHAEKVARLASAIRQSGFLDLVVPVEHGGAGLGLIQLHELAMICGELLLPIPIAETMVARRLSTRAGLYLPDDAWVAIHDGRSPVVHGQHATHLLRQEGDRLCICLAEARGRDIWRTAGGHMPRVGQELLSWPQAGAQLDCALAALASAWIAGALRAMADLTLTHATVRTQFGRPIAGFQAIQQMLAILAEEVAAAAAASRIAFAGQDFDWAAVAVAKVRTGKAAASGSAVASQVHGALALTDEYAVGILARHLAEWREAGLGESHWAIRLGSLVKGRASSPLLDALCALARPGHP